tara:strand:- start:40 stop:525 length:486 start_codon:yes stop_codon:yes gene_type:complete
MIRAVLHVRVMLHVVLVITVIITDVQHVLLILKPKQQGIYKVVQPVRVCVKLIIMVTMDLVLHVQMVMRMLLVINNSVPHVHAQRNHRARQMSMEMATDVQHVRRTHYQKMREIHKIVLCALVNVKQTFLVTMACVRRAQPDTHAQKVTILLVQHVRVKHV